MTYTDFLNYLEQNAACEDGKQFALKCKGFSTLFSKLNEENRFNYALWLRRRMPSVFRVLVKKFPKFTKYDYSGSFNDGFAIVGLKGKLGLIDQDGKELTPLKYDNIKGFSDGLARVTIDSKFGFVNEEGQEIIPVNLDFAYSFYDGSAHVKSNEKWMVIDKQGNEV